MVYCLVNRLGYIEGFVQDGSNSIANAMEPLQSRARPLIWPTNVKSFCVFIHIIPIVSSICFVTDYTLIPHNSNEGTETAKGLYIPVVIKITNINLHTEVSMTHNGNICAYYYIYLSNKQKNRVMWLVMVQGTDLI